MLVIKQIRKKSVYNIVGAVYNIVVVVYNIVGVVFNIVGVVYIPPNRPFWSQKTGTPRRLYIP